MAARFNGRRFGMGLNAAVSVLLAAVLVLMVHYISGKHWLRVDLSRSQYYGLSEGTLHLLENLESEVKMIVLAGSEHDLARDARILLREYEHASPRVQVEYVDPNRDLARTRELAVKYFVERSDIVILIAGDRRKIVALDELADYDYSPAESGLPRKMAAFRGEQAISSALQSLAAMQDPVVYFLAGHGEARIDSYDQYFGCSIIARTLRRENIQARTLAFEEGAGVPVDCAVLIVAGPSRRLARVEINMIKTYLANSGRLLLMLDSGVETGLEEMLAGWSVLLANDRVVGTTLTGRELVISEYGDHAITRHLDNVRTVMNVPRSVRPAVTDDPAGTRAADKPLLTVLATSSPKGWAEMTLDQNPPVFDDEIDRSGPIPVAIAVEMGALKGVDVELKSARMVVLGDSSLVSNGALLAGYNTGFFIGALNWLLERGSSLDISPKRPVALRVMMTLAQARLACWVVAVAVPAAVLIIGFVVWVVRRR